MTEERVLQLFKCLADRSRLRIVQSLLQEEMYVERLAQRLGLTPATISFHLKKLEEAGLVTLHLACPRASRGWELAVPHLTGSRVSPKS